jgi:hypothetical protein
MVSILLFCEKALPDMNMVSVSIIIFINYIFKVYNINFNAQFTFLLFRQSTHNWTAKNIKKLTVRYGSDITQLVLPPAGGAPQFGSIVYVNLHMGGVVQFCANKPMLHTVFIKKKKKFFHSMM